MKSIVMEVVELHEQGCSVEEIASLLGMSPYEVSGTIFQFEDMARDEARQFSNSSYDDPYEFEGAPI